MPGSTPWFRSDNVSGVCPEILAALVAANDRRAQAYGADAITGTLDALFGGLFECSVGGDRHGRQCIGPGRCAGAHEPSAMPMRTSCLTKRGPWNSSAICGLLG
jgi:hypothetical protein